MLNNADNILFRCSSLGHIMTESRSALTEKQAEKIKQLQAKDKLTANQLEELERLIYKRDNPDPISDTCKTHLVDVFVSKKYGRREEKENKFLKKGNAREEDAITLVSRLLKTMFVKNTERLNDDFIEGEPDLFIGESIRNAEVTIDTKCSWSAHTFFRAKNSGVNSDYYWQGNGYMRLTKAKKHLIAYCLVNGTDKAINDEKKRLAYNLDIIDHASERYDEYIEKCKQIEINHIFDIESFKNEYPYFDFHNDVANWKWDIPMRERLFMYEIERNESEIARIKSRVIECREYMNKTFFNTEKILP